MEVNGICVEVALPAAVEASRLMRPQEGSGRGNSSSGGVVGRGRWSTEVAVGEFGRKDNVHAINDASDQAFWLKNPDPELHVEEAPACLASSDAFNGCGLSKRNVNSSRDVDAKLLLKKSGKVVRNHNGCAKRSGMVKLEVSKCKLGLDDANGIFPELASPSACSSMSAKHQLIKQKNSLTCGRRDKRNNKVKYKNRCDSFSLKNGLVGFNSPAGGNDFSGMYGLKHDLFDITKYTNELSLDELLRGSYTHPSSAKDKGIEASYSNDNLLQSVRKVSSILQARKGLQEQNSGDTESSSIQASNGLVTASYGVVPTDGTGGGGCSVDLQTSDKVGDSDGKFNISTIADSPLYQPEDILDRLALPPANVSDLLVSDASKTSLSKHSSDPRLGKTASHRNGLPPFPWSHSFSGNNKLGSDSLKLSTSRTICQGRWVKVKNCTGLQKGSVDLLVDFELLTFDRSLVPLSSLSEHPENQVSPVERGSSASLASSSSKSPDDEYSTYIAAQTLLDMGACSREDTSEALKLIRKPSQVGMKSCKLKAAIPTTDKIHVDSKSRTRPAANPIKLGDDVFPSKKHRLSADPANAYGRHAEPVRRLTSTTHPFFKSPPTRIFKATPANTDTYSANIVKKSYMMRLPRVTDLSSDSQQKFRKLAE